MTVKIIEADLGSRLRIPEDFHSSSSLCQEEENKSGLISVPVIDKSTGKYKVRKTIGWRTDPEKVTRLAHKGNK
ncbi:hypothetical protein N6H18_16220 [Reichenbachiella agarivorans]|uniref:Uncharacterized protein n=1 Tax=Reichenbachiella agarivorans TaxID=2979464 RepID=A0ABY6CN06_9BACT|nr:hypothetical protein [Reichenbachiella agarivorans]UXP31892.1 hypothetical protein N6H18_16220 [Reichenbachiella agarivorans]